MKIKKFFVAAMAAMTLFASCSKENEGVQVSGDTMAMKIKLTYGDGASTYSVEDPTTGNPVTTLANALIFQMIGDQVKAVTELNAEQLAQMTSASGCRIEDVNADVNGVLVVGNIPSVAMATLKGSASRQDIENCSAVTVITQQSGIKTVIVQGYGTASEKTDPDAGHTASHTYKEAAVTVAPIVARMEIVGAPTLASGNTYSSVTWKAVYFNRYFTDFGKASMINIVKKEELPMTGWMRDAWNVSATGKTKCYAYQFFPAVAENAFLLPVLVLEGSFKPSVGADEIKYVTINTYKKGTAAIAKMEPNKIYKVDLSGLQISNPQIAEDPTPDQSTDLGVVVTVLPWTVENITPEI